MRLMKQKITSTTTSSWNNFCSVVKFSRRRKHGNLTLLIALSLFSYLSTPHLKNITFVSYGDQNVHTNVPWVKQRYLPPPRTTVFYNVFTKSGDDEERVKAIVNEQFSFLDPKRHVVSITSIGHSLPNITNYNTTNNERINITLRKHYTEGNEGLTLHALWDFCRQPANNNHDTKVVYIHSKGSFHDKPQNTVLRSFLTIGALSEDCHSLPSQCDVCSSRMSPLPHPHTPGNMWLARCDYISKLADPYILEDDKRLPLLFKKQNWCRGFGRYFFEHWVHSHPYVKPCDLYTNPSYVWDYSGVPKQAEWFDNSSSSPTAQKQLQMAPRFDYEVYFKKRHCKNTRASSMEERIYNYKHLYPSLFANTSASANISTSLAMLDKSWWGWEFFLE
jgi:hypothetical protein